MTFVYIFGGITLIVVLWAVFTYNSLISLVNRAKEAWSDIDIQLKRRYDLIPNLVNTVKAYASHESSTFDKVTNARAAAIGANSLEEKGKAELGLTGAIKSLFAVAENYPDLKANQNFLELQRELSDTENKIQSARRFYNGNVMELNTKIEQFPANIIANLFNFVKMEFFELEEDDKVAKNPVEVKF
jgi:LemA protein